MQIWKRAGVIAALIGCGSAPPTAPEMRTAARTVDGPDAKDPGSLLRCPDGTTDCTQTNGTGVYTAEGGYAGIDTLEAKLMITHFINHPGTAPPSVTFDGRYYDPKTPQWLAAPLLQPGVVEYADYGVLQGLVVASVTESATMPTWTLLDTTVSPPAPVTVTDAGLGDLRLHIRFARQPSSPDAAHFVLAFAPQPAVTGNKTTLQPYAMTWERTDPGFAPAAPRPYCFRDAIKQEHPDPVVFQQGIDVDPVNGRVTRSSDTANLVTLSCSLGAPATVHKWGYPYRTARIKQVGFPQRPVGPVHPGPTFYFDAGIQMKRASYCADETYHTVRGTHIEIDDDWPIMQSGTKRVEAFWTPAGATCLNYVRVPVMKFTGECRGRPLPACPPLPPPVKVQRALEPRGPDAYLVDGLP